MLNLNRGLSHPAHSSVIQIVGGAVNVTDPLGHTQRQPMRFKSVIVAPVFF